MDKFNLVFDYDLLKLKLLLLLLLLLILGVSLLNIDRRNTIGWVGVIMF
jgi:hypothetical protein